MRTDLNAACSVYPLQALSLQFTLYSFQKKRALLRRDQVAFAFVSKAIRAFDQKSFRVPVHIPGRKKNHPVDDRGLLELRRLRARVTRADRAIEQEAHRYLKEPLNATFLVAPQRGREKRRRLPMPAPAPAE